MWASISIERHTQFLIPKNPLIIHPDTRFVFLECQTAWYSSSNDIRRTVNKAHFISTWPNKLVMKSAICEDVRYS